jgi:hypothetical protein
VWGHSWQLHTPAADRHRRPHVTSVGVRAGALSRRQPLPHISSTPCTTPSEQQRCRAAALQRRQQQPLVSRDTPGPGPVHPCCAQCLAAMSLVRRRAQEERLGPDSLLEACVKQLVAVRHLLGALGRFGVQPRRATDVLGGGGAPLLPRPAIARSRRLLARGRTQPYNRVSRTLNQPAVRAAAAVSSRARR